VRIHYDHQVFSLQNTGGNTRYHFELMRHLAAYSGVNIDLFLGCYPAENLGVCHPERSEYVRPGGRTREVEGPLFRDNSPMGGPQLPSSGNCGELRITAWNSNIPPGSRRYLINDVLNSAHVLRHGPFDIYHPTHHRYLPLVRARRMVATLHDCTQEKFPEEFRYNHRVLHYRKALFARADAIICISAASRQDLLRFYRVDESKIRVIHHGVTQLTEFASKEMLRGTQSARPYLLYVGSRALYKNFRALLHAFRDSGLPREFDLRLVGGGPLSPTDSRLIAELGLTQIVVHTERVDDALLAKAYSDARLLVYPSLSEGFGLPPLEAMHLGCPVLVCNTSCLPEICGDAAFYFEPNSSESLTQALRSAAYDETARTRAVWRGREVASQYSWEKCAAETLAVYRECR
jgi:glycosyltransferase involved in cell wall biosynthesis